MNVASFPYDEQYCVIKFGTWSYDMSYVDLAILRTYPVIQEGDDAPDSNREAEVKHFLVLFQESSTFLRRFAIHPADQLDRPDTVAPGIVWEKSNGIRSSILDRTKSAWTCPITIEVPSGICSI